MKKYFYAGALVLFVSLCAVGVWADTVNPTSNVIADSANTASAIILRDSNGDFSARDVSVRAIIPSDTSSSRNHAPFVSTTTLATITTVRGDMWSTLINGNRYTTCTSSASAVNSVVLSTNTTVRCSDAASQSPSGIP